MWSGVEKVDSAGGGSQHRDAARLRQLRALRLTLLVAVFAAAPLAAQQEQQRVVRGLSFEGNHAIDDYILSTANGTSNSSWFARAFPIRLLGLGEKRSFNELEFRRDVIRLLLLYRQSGYMNAVIDTLVRREGRDVYLKFRIYEGDPVRLARLDILGVDSIFDVRRLKRDLPLQEGDPFNRALFQASADTVVSRLKNLGYPYADILRNYDVDVAALRAVATLEALPGERMRVGQVLITGAEKVDTGTLRRMLSVRAGDWFRQDQLYLTQRDLYGLGMFRSANVVLADTTPPPGESTVRVVVRVSEAPRHRIRVGAGYGSLDCFRVQSGWTAYDFLGGARSLDLTGQLSKLGVGLPADAGFKQNVCPPLHDDPTSDTANYNATLTLRQPAFLSPRHTASFAVFAERRSEFKAYTRQAVGANVAVTFNARRDVPVTVGYGYSVGRTTADPAVYCQRFLLCNESDQAFLANRRPFGAITISGIRNRTNSVLDPTAGSVVTTSLTHSSRLVGSDTLYEFNRGQLEVSRYSPVGHRRQRDLRGERGIPIPDAALPRPHASGSVRGRGAGVGAGRSDGAWSATHPGRRRTVCYAPRSGTSRRSLQRLCRGARSAVLAEHGEQQPDSRDRFGWAAGDRESRLAARVLAAGSRSVRRGPGVLDDPPLARGRTVDAGGAARRLPGGAVVAGRDGSRARAAGARQRGGAASSLHRDDGDRRRARVAPHRADPLSSPVVRCGHDARRLATRSQCELQPVRLRGRPGRALRIRPAPAGDQHRAAPERPAQHRRAVAPRRSQQGPARAGRPHLVPERPHHGRDGDLATAGEAPRAGRLEPRDRERRPQRAAARPSLRAPRCPALRPAGVLPARAGHPHRHLPAGHGELGPRGASRGRGGTAAGDR